MAMYSCVSPNDLNSMPDTASTLSVERNAQSEIHHSPAQQRRVERASLTTSDGSELISVGMVAGNYFQVLGVRPHLGRLLTPEDDRVRNGHPVAVLQYEFGGTASQEVQRLWTPRFA